MATSVHLEGGRAFAVKMAPRDSGACRREAAGLALAAGVAADWVPRCHGVAEVDDFDVLVTDYEDMLPVSPAQVLRPPVLPQALALLSRLAPLTLTAPDDLSARVGAYLSANAPEALRAPWWRQTAALLEAPTGPPQHGDFVAYNLGLRRDGWLIAFDWEDFGLITLPGYDAAILLGHACGHNAEQLLALMTGRRDIADGLSGLGLSADTFRQRLPLYYAVFACLKAEGGYDRALCEQLLATLKALAESIY